MPTLGLKAYGLIVFFVIIQRLAELRVSKRNQKALIARGAYEVGREHYPAMVVLHASWLAACLGGAWWVQTPPPAWQSHLALFTLVVGQLLRWAAMTTLAERWTTVVMLLPGQAPVARGIYRHVRHPNYWGVQLEIMALPAAFGLWAVALFFGLANALLLRYRLKVEEAALKVMAEGPR